jgi:predicted ArsR family transcriptional regulator
MHAHAATMLAERQRQALASNYGDVDIPAARTVLMRLLADPSGTNATDVAAVIGKTKSTAHRYLSALHATGVARLNGTGRGARFRLTSSSRPPGPARPPLALVPPPDEDDDSEPSRATAGDVQ